MLSIENLAFNGLEGSVTVIIDGQQINRCRISTHPRTLAVTVIPPASAAGVEWGDHSLEDFNVIVRQAINAIGKPN